MQSDSQTAKRPPGSLDPVVMCVRHRTGWCELLDQRNTAYRDVMETVCGHIVALPWGIERRQPDCPECKKAHNDPSSATPDLSANNNPKP